MKRFSYICHTTSSVPAKGIDNGRDIFKGDEVLN